MTAGNASTAPRRAPITPDTRLGEPGQREKIEKVFAHVPRRDRAAIAKPAGTIAKHTNTIIEHGRGGALAHIALGARMLEKAEPKNF